MWSGAGGEVCVCGCLTLQGVCGVEWAGGVVCLNLPKYSYNNSPSYIIIIMCNFIRCLRGV